MSLKVAHLSQPLSVNTSRLPSRRLSSAIVYSLVADVPRMVASPLVYSSIAVMSRAGAPSVPLPRLNFWMVCRRTKKVRMNSRSVKRRCTRAWLRISKPAIYLSTVSSTKPWKA